MRLTYRKIKGGSGKTEGETNLLGALAMEFPDRKFLGIDLDPSAKLTKHVGINPLNIKAPTLFEVYHQNVPISSAIRKTEFGFDLIPGTRLNEAIDDALEPGDELMLSNFLKDIDDEYDIIIIDLPAGDRELSLQGVAASDVMIIPFIAKSNNLDSVSEALDNLRDVVWEHNPNLEFLGIHPLCVRRIGSHSLSALKKAREIWGNKVLDFEAAESDIFPASYGLGMPTVAYKPKHPAVQSYFALARFVMEKKMTFDKEQKIKRAEARKQTSKKGNENG